MRNAAEARAIALSYRPISEGFVKILAAIELAIIGGELNISHRNKDADLIYTYEWNQLEVEGYKLNQSGNYLQIKW